MWICSGESSKHGGGVSLRQVRQEVDSEVRGLKVHEGESSSSSQQFQCAILPSRSEGVIKKKEKKEKRRSTQGWMGQDKNQGMKGGEDFCLWWEHVIKNVFKKTWIESHEGEVGCKERIKFPPFDRGNLLSRGERISFPLSRSQWAWTAAVEQVEAKKELFSEREARSRYWNCTHSHTVWCSECVSEV